MYIKIIAALKKIIEGDYKTVENKFISKINDAPLVKNYMDTFKKLRNEHRIKDVEKRNIDYWGKKEFEVFKEFVDSLSTKKSKTKTKKDLHKVANKINGATLVAENEDWLVYYVYEYEAAKLLGTHNWCIVREENHWDDYTKGDPSHNFYFCLAKNRPEDEFYKIAALRDNSGDETCYDFNDKQQTWEEIKKDLNIPDFEMEIPPEYCDNCHNVKEYCECCSICNGNRDYCDCCYNCERTRDYCTCCPECGDDDKRQCGCWCNNCDELMDDCNCCSICHDEDKDSCDCCQECESQDKYTCGCWCTECDKLIKECDCERCSDCKSLIDECKCERCSECEKLVNECECKEEEKQEET